MMVELGSIVPRDVAPLCRSMVIAEDSGDFAAVDGEAIRGGLARFAATFWQPDAQAVASLWSMFYFNALIVPTVAVLVCCDRLLPVALADVSLQLDAKYRPQRLSIANPGRPADDADCGRRFATLIDDHLEPFIALFAGRTGLSPRLLWSNAAVILDHAIGAVAGSALPQPYAEAMALMTGPAAHPHLADAFRTAADGTRERKICCTRHRLSGVSPCYVVCPGRDAYMGVTGAGARRHGPHGDD